MNTPDILLLSSSKIKTRRLRTIASTITISALFGVIIAAFLIINGLRTSLEASANTVQNGSIYLNALQSTSNFNNQEIMTRAIELYKMSSDPDKQYPLITAYPSGEEMAEPYLDKNNIFALQAADERKEAVKQDLSEKIAKKTQGYDVSVFPIETYTVRADSIDIDSNHTLPDSGKSLIYLPRDTVTPLIQVSSPEKDTIPVIVPADIAGQIAGLGQLSASATNEQREEYIVSVQEKAIGLVYTATLRSESSEREVKYQIVGLLPPLGSLRIAKKSNDFHILDLILSNLGADTPSFITTDTSSQLFDDTYTSNNVYSISANYLLEFADVRQAADFRAKYSCSIIENRCQDFYVHEILNNHINLYDVFGSVDGLLIIFVVFFSIVAVIIMTSTLSRIFDDERQAIALYRSMGATTWNIIQIYASYIMMLCILACVSALMIGAALAAAATALSISDLTSNIKYFYGMSEFSGVTLLRFDPRILLVFVTIFAVGGFCFLLLLDKLASRDISKDLKS